MGSRRQGHNAKYDPNYYDQTISKFTYAQTILKNEYEAGHYITKNQAIIYFPGANFSWYKLWSQETIHEHYELLWNSYKQDLFTVDIDGDGESDGIDAFVMPAHWSTGFTNDDHAAVSYFATSEDYPGMAMTFNSLINWRKDLSTFPIPDYETQSVPSYVPDSEYHIDNGGTSANSLFCQAENTHLSQVGYNAMGQEIGVSLYNYLRADGGEAEVTEFKLFDSNDNVLDVAYDNEPPKTVEIYEGQSFLIGSRILPVYVSNLTYELTGDAAEIVWPLQVKGVSEGQATLTVKQGQTLLAEVNFQVKAAHTHCECGGALAGSHDCDQSLTYVPLDKSNFTDNRYYNEKLTAANASSVLRGGNYFLTKDMSVSSIFVASGETVNLCLNGYKLTTTERSFRPNGNLNICDCSEEGTGAVHSKYTGNGPVLYTYSGAQVKIYGGTYTAVAGKNREMSGLLGVYTDAGMLDYDADRDGATDDPAPVKQPASLTIYGGIFYGTDLSCSDGDPLSYGRGACITVGSGKGTLVVYDGTFHGANTVPTEQGGSGGGGIIAAASGTLELHGGTFQGSTDPKGAIYFAKEVPISGKLSFDNEGPDLYAGSGGMLNVGQLDEETSVVLGSAVLDTPVVTLSDAAQASHFTGMEGYTVTQDGLSLSVSKELPTSVCVCGGTISEEAKKLSGHECQTASWQAWNFDGFTLSTKYVQTETELYLYLTQDLTVDYPIEIPDGCSLHINLNGYTLSASKILTSSLLRVYGNLTICDTSAEKTGLVQGIRKTGSETTTVALINYSTSTSTAYTPQFDLYGGTLTGYNVDATGDTVHTYAKQGGVMQIGNNSNNQNPVFNMYGGVIRDGAAMTAGNVFLSQGTINMYDGLITGGKIVSGDGTGTKYYGGNLRMNSKTTLNMYGGTISGGTNEVGVGGNLLIAGGTMKLLGGSIENGLAEEQGGNVYINSGTVTIQNMQILGGCGSSGGNLYIAGGKVTMTNTKIADGRAGFAYTRNTDGSITVTEGTSSGNGGNIYMAAGSAELTDCIVSGGKARVKGTTNGLGGNIIHRGQLKMTGCTVSGGSGRHGGGISIRDTGSAASVTELINCTFLNNSTSNVGSSLGVYATANGATVTITGCSFDDSEGSSVNGVISTTSSDALTGTVSLSLEDCQINNQGSSKRYGLYIRTGTVTLKGNTTINAANGDVYLKNSTLYIGEDYTNTDTVGFACDEGGKVVPQGSCTANLEAQGTLHLDLNGQVLTGDITGSGTLVLIDTATDDYTGTYGKLIGTVSASMERLNTVDEKNYLVLTEQDGYSAHRYALELTHVSLDPKNDALGYKAKLSGDEAVLAATTEFGFDMGIVDGNTRNYAKAFDGDTVFTLRLKNIMKVGGGEMGVCAEAYVKIGDLTIRTGMEQTSMKDAILAVNDLTDLTDSQKAAVYELYASYKDVMDAWFAADVTNNIAAWAPTEE